MIYSPMWPRLNPIFSCPPQNILKDNQKGQSTVELLITFMCVLGSIFLFVRIAFNMTDGYLVHYATFMASRSYLVLDTGANDPAFDDTDPTGVVKKVFAKYERYLLPAGRVPGQAKIENFNFPTDGSYFPGVTYKYTTQFSLSTFIGTRKPMELQSESFLGREPSIAGCLEGIARAFRILGCQGGGGGQCMHATFTDDGC